MGVPKCEVRKTHRRKSGDPTDVIVGPRAMAGGDHPRQPVEHDAVVGANKPGRDGAINSNAAVDVVVPDRSADDARDDVGDLGHCERLRTGGPSTSVVCRELPMAP